jgi:hypothetical protein
VGEEVPIIKWKINSEGRKINSKGRKINREGCSIIRFLPEKYSYALE